MYLIPFLAVCLIYAGALIMCLRLRASNDKSTYLGVASRVCLMLLLLTLVALFWYYSGYEHMESTSVAVWMKVVSALIYLGLLPQIWADKDS